MKKHLGPVYLNKNATPHPLRRGALGHAGNHARVHDARQPVRRDRAHVRAVWVVERHQ